MITLMGSWTFTLIYPPSNILTNHGFESWNVFVETNVFVHKIVVQTDNLKLWHCNRSNIYKVLTMPRIIPIHWHIHRNDPNRFIPVVDAWWSSGNKLIIIQIILAYHIHMWTYHLEYTCYNNINWYGFIVVAYKIKIWNYASLILQLDIA